MSALSRRVSMGVGAVAIATAATLTPVTTAHAAPLAPVAVSTLGSQVGAAATTGASATPGSFVQGIFQNSLWWIGRANPNPPPSSDVLVFTPISLVPGFLKPVYGWFTKNLNFELCFAGASVKVGPYGTTTVSVSRQGC